MLVGAGIGVTPFASILKNIEWQNSQYKKGFIGTGTSLKKACRAAPEPQGLPSLRGSASLPACLAHCLPQPPLTFALPCAPCLPCSTIAY